jgi:D-alanyl-D-alanine dipeptidase
VFHRPLPRELNDHEKTLPLIIMNKYRPTEAQARIWSSCTCSRLRQIVDGSRLSSYTPSASRGCVWVMTGYPLHFAP